MESYSALAASYDELTQDVGSVLDGEEAVSSGLIDRLERRPQRRRTAA